MIKKIIIILIFTFLVSPLTVWAQDVPAEALRSACEVNDRQCVLEVIRNRNKAESYDVATGQIDPTKIPWIGLQVPIPSPNCMSLSNVLCHDGYIVGVKNISTLVVTLFQFATIMIAIFLVLMMVIGGVMYLTSGGDAGRASQAMDYIKNASYSLVVIFFSVIILYQINPELINPQIEVESITTQQATISCFDSSYTQCGLAYAADFSISTLGSAAQCRGSACSAGQFCRCLVDPSLPECNLDGNPPASLCQSKVADGSDCENHIQCTSNFCLNKKCVTPNAGAACETSQSCGGLVCETLGSDSCSFGRTAADCSNDTECADGYFCWDFNGFGSACVPRTNSLFQVCNSDSQCAPGLHCSGESCVPRDAEGFCNSNDQCETIANASLPSLNCIIPNNGSAFGQCSNGRLGSFCTNNDHCLSKICWTSAAIGICSDGQVGDYCSENGDCRSGNCSNNFCQP